MVSFDNSSRKLKNFIITYFNSKNNSPNGEFTKIIKSVRHVDKNHKITYPQNRRKK
jgi:hypothetical protein